MLDQVDSSKEMVDLNSLAELTGFPKELLQKELFNDVQMSELSLAKLREVVVNYIDATMLEVEQSEEIQRQ